LGRRKRSKPKRNPPFFSAPLRLNFLYFNTLAGKTENREIGLSRKAAKEIDQ
jgi:hypothetical protein